MKSLLTINILFLIILCNKYSSIHKIIEKNDTRLSDTPKIKSKIEIKSTNYLLHKHSQQSYNLNNKFTANNSYCKLNKDSLIFHFGYLIWGASNMNIIVVNDSSKFDFSKSDCLAYIQYQTFYSRIEFEKRRYSVGDSIELSVSYKGFGQYYEERKSDKDDTVEVSGKIRLKIRDRKYYPKL